MALRLLSLLPAWLPLVGDGLWSGGRIGWPAFCRSAIIDFAGNCALLRNCIDPGLKTPANHVVFLKFFR